MATTIDRRRNNGPAFSHPPKFAPSEDVTMHASAETTTTTTTTTHPPKFFLQTGLVAKCNGSAYYEGDGIKLVVTVHGPRPVSRIAAAGSTGLATAQVTVEAKFAPFAVSLDRPRRGYVRDTQERSLGETLKMALAKAIRTKAYPKSEISLHLLVLELPPASSSDTDKDEEDQDDDDDDDTQRRVIAASINALSAALADAAIEMVDLVASAAVSIPGSKNGVVVGYMPHRDEVTLVHATTGLSRRDGGDGDDKEAKVSLLVQEAIERAKVVNLAIAKVLIS